MKGLRVFLPACAVPQPETLRYAQGDGEHPVPVAAARLAVGGIVFAFLIALVGCSDSGNPVDPDPDPDPPVGRIPDVVEPDVIVEMPGQKISQLVGDYDNEKDEPTANRTFTRYQLRSTDLGVPFQHDGRTWILFGDSFGPKGGDAIAYTTDVNPEDGLSLDFIEDDAGIYEPVRLPGISQGAFEVPVEGIDVGGSMYIYHTTDHSGQVMMGRSVVARSDDGGETFTVLYNLSRKYFINVSIVKVTASNWDLLPETEGEGLVIFGSGRYRESDVYLAFQPASEIENPNAIRYFAGVDEPGEPLWSDDELDALPVFEHPCVGELSASFNTFIDKWILLYNCGQPRGITLRTAGFPWGPWTRSQILFHPWDDGGYCNFMHVNWQNQQCDSVHDPGRENEWGGEYGPYQFEHLATGDDQSTTIYFTMSTWNPYTVVLMKGSLRKTTQAAGLLAGKPL